DIAIEREELEGFTTRFNEILEYFDLLDQVQGDASSGPDTCNVLREDEVEPSLPQDSVLANAGEKEEGFFKAPRVM
ncbi:MAG: Asp-tRNA(Asn)/Glu-tRNA(Gln) amidotransferase subunit GatC, partial [Methanolinea sp.]|nr:Asp-tRNA(Asn)/Glu-tRNA(Gln) amidotransferase subunit GatC [Methanolinea sp.]